MLYRKRWIVLTCLVMLVQTNRGDAQNPIPDDEATKRTVLRLRAELQHDDFKVRLAAVTALGKLGPKAISAAPDLWKTVNDEKYRKVLVAAAMALGKIDSPETKFLVRKLILEADGHTSYHLSWLDDFNQRGVPQLIALLQDENEDAKVRRRAAHAIPNVRPQNNMAIAPLVVTLNDSEVTVRGAASRALQSFSFSNSRSKPIALALIQTLETDSARDRALTVTTLVDLWRTPAGVLTTALRSRSPVVRAAAAEALGRNRFSSPSKDVIPNLVSALDDKNRDVRLNAAEALVGINRAPEAVSPLGLLLLDEERAVRIRAAAALGRMGKVAKPAIKALRSALQDDEMSVRLEAANAMVAVDRQMSAPAVPVLAGTMKEASPRDRQRAANIGAELGPIAVGMVPSLLANLGHESQEVRLCAAEAIMRINPKQQKSAMTVILEFLSNETFARHRPYNGSMRSASVRAVGRVGPAAVAAAPHLRAIFEKKNSDSTSDRDRVQAASAYVSVVPERSSDGLEILLRAIESESGVERHSAADEMIRLGPAAKTCVPALRKLLRHTDEEVQKLAREVLATLAPARSQASIGP